MNGPSREEIDAKLETIEARMDGRLASIEAKIDGLASAMNERFGSLYERFRSLEQRMDGVETSVRSLETTMIVTAVSSVIAIVLGVAVFNATLLSNMLASFESGKNTSTVQAELKRQADETAVLLEQLLLKIARISKFR